MPQSLNLIILHIIFSTKNREPFIDETLKSELYPYLAKLCQDNESHAYRVGGFDDHVHLAVNFPRTLSVSKFLEEIKKRSSYWAKTKGARYQSFSWQKGYGCFSVGYRDLKLLVDYIDNQGEHHKKVTFQEEYRKFLTKYKIDFDERYVWD